MLHLVFAVWKTSFRPFNGEHYPWAKSEEVAKTGRRHPLKTSAAAVVQAKDENKTAVGHTRDLPAGKVVTATSFTVERPVRAGQPPYRGRAARGGLCILARTCAITQVLEHLAGLIGQLRGRGQQRRCTCPVHGQPTDSSRTFSVHLFKNVFRCFHAECGVQGNVLDLWAAIHRLPLYEAGVALLAETFGATAEQRRGTRKRNPLSRAGPDAVAESSGARQQEM